MAHSVYAVIKAAFTITLIRVRVLLAVLYTGYTEHEFACIPIAAVHNNTGSVYEYELP